MNRACLSLRSLVARANLNRLWAGQNGAALIGLIVTMVLLAVLGAAMLSTTSTSTFNQVYGTQSTKAFDLAESGYRYATMDFLTSSPGGDDCLSCHSSSTSSTIDIKGVEGGELSDATIKTHGQTYTLSDGGQFEIRLAPFWFKSGKDTSEATNDLNVGAKTLTVYALASSDNQVQYDFPERFKTGKPVTNGGHLRIGGGTIQYVSYENITKSTRVVDSVTVEVLVFNNLFRYDPNNYPNPLNLLALTDEINVYPTCLVDGPQTLNKDGDLDVKNIQGGDIYAFPDAKSIIKVNGMQITYRHVEKESGQWKLTGLDNLDSDNPVLPFDVLDNDIVTLSECIKITSTGAYSGASRAVVYYEPIAPSMEIPIVYYTGDSEPTEYLAGGNFYWVAQTGGDARGHNVLGISGVDGSLSEAPGNPQGCANSCYYSLATTSYGAPGCQGCHQSMVHEINTSGHVTSSPWYRFLKGHMSGDGWGVEGIEDDDWQATKGAGDHNEYLCYSGNKEYAAAFYNLGKTMTAYCCGCHGNFHKEQDSSGNWIRHPSDALIPSTAGSEYADAFGANGTGTGTYDPKVPVARPNFTGFTGPKSTVAIGTDMVMCLSCHAAHGSPYSASLRWSTATRTSSNGCLTCHTQKSTGHHKCHASDCTVCHDMHGNPGNPKGHLLRDSYPGCGGGGGKM